MRLDYDGKRLGAVTISLGVAVFPHHAGALLREADAAMYEAKKAGRNRVVMSMAAPAAAD